MQPPNPVLAKAFQLFVNELKLHLEWFETALLPDLTAGHLGVIDRERRGIEHRLHQIRGGAGFLELHNIPARIRNVEEALKKSVLEDSAPLLLDLIEFLDAELERFEKP